MTDRERRPHVYAAADHMYQNQVDQYVKDNLEIALMWALNTLRDREGSGHDFQLTAEPDGQFRACFAKPQWNADHCSQPMPTAQEAIVMAVCEYVSGV